jgi:2-oxoglutarate ferredoxin oxidoreductase subunit alpha
LNLKHEEAEKMLEEKWFLDKDREWNLKALEEWIEFGKNHGWVKSDFSNDVWDPLSMQFGNWLIADGSAKAWLEFYSAYPMTPASTIINGVLKHPEITFQQWEDEIAVSMMMLGASYVWKRAMCGTSGWGFALMVESLTFANQAEIWWVYVLSQRDGPSTWTPTFVAQWDLDIALNAWFGETKPIVLAPSTYEEAYEIISRALNRSEIYQHPVIFLVDKTLSECLMSIDISKLKEPIIKHWEIVKESDSDNYLRYKNTENWISPRAIPWTKNTLFIASSYEHTESWSTNENPKIKVQQMGKRARKMETFKKEELKDWIAYEIINPNAKNFFITWWINRYPIEKVISENNDWWLIVIKVFQPFNESLRKFFEEKENQIENLLFVELNHDWSCERYICSQCWLTTNQWNKKINHLRKYNLYPFMVEEIEDKIK